MAIVSRRYAEALFDIAIELDKVEEFEQQLEILLSDILTDELYEVVNYPAYSISKKVEIIEAVTEGKIDKYIVNFLEILLQNERIYNINEIVQDYKELVNSYKNTLEIEVTSAFELEDAQIEKIKQKMKKQYKAQNVNLKIVIDPQVIGGVKIKKDDTIIDGTLKTKLENIKNEIIRNTLV